MGSLNVVETLEEARVRVAKGWCQYLFEEHDSDGNVIAWCMSGATGWSNVALEADRFLTQAVGGECISEWNDIPGRTQTEVLSAFDRAIALAKAVQP